MPALQVKDCPSDIYDELRACASNEDRSISQQTVHILRKYLALYKEASKTSADPDQLVFNSPERAMLASDVLPEKRRERQRALDLIAELPPIGIPSGFASIPEMIREGREERASFVDSLIEDAR